VPATHPPGVRDRQASALAARGQGFGAARLAATHVLPSGWRALYAIGLTPRHVGGLDRVQTLGWAAGLGLAGRRELETISRAELAGP
jgi:hypothetical protein